MHIVSCGLLSFNVCAPMFRNLHLLTCRHAILVAVALLQVGPIRGAETNTNEFSSSAYFAGSHWSTFDGGDGNDGSYSGTQAVTLDSGGTFQATSSSRYGTIVSENFDTGVTFTGWYWTGGNFENPPTFGQAWNRTSTANQFFTTSFDTTSLEVGDVMTATFQYNPNSVNIGSVRVGLFSGTAATGSGWDQWNNATAPSSTWTGYTGTLAIAGVDSVAALKGTSGTHPFFGAPTASNAVAQSFGTGELRAAGLFLTRMSNGIVVTLAEGTTFASLAPVVSYTDGTSALTNFNILSFYSTTTGGNVDMRYDTVRVGLSNAVTWSGAGSAWLTSSNWLAGVAPGASSVAQFGTNAPASVGIDMALNSGAQTVGAIELTTARNSALVVSNSSTTAAGTLTLSGIDVAGTSSVVVRNASAQLLTIANGSQQQLNVVLGNSTNNIVRVDGAGGITIASAISGAGRMLTKAGAGAGVLTLSGSNTFTGGVNLETGTLRIENASALGTGTLAQGAGTALQVATTGTITNQMSLYNVSVLQTATFSGNISLNNATFEVASGQTATFSGVLSNTGGVTKTGPGLQVLTGDNTFTGAVSVQAGTLELAGLGGNKAGGSTSAISVAAGATLLLSQSSQFNNAAAVTLSGGTIRRGAGVSEVFGNLNLSAASFLDFGTGNAGTLAFGTYAPSALLTVQNFLPGNKLTFGSDLTGSIGNTELFSFQGDFNSDWNGSTFTITAIPEPSTWAVAAGLFAILVFPLCRKALRRTAPALPLATSIRSR